MGRVHAKRDDCHRVCISIAFFIHVMYDGGYIFTFRYIIGLFDCHSGKQYLTTLSRFILHETQLQST